MTDGALLIVGCNHPTTVPIFFISRTSAKIPGASIPSSLQTRIYVCSIASCHYTVWEKSVTLFFGYKFSVADIGNIFTECIPHGIGKLCISPDEARFEFFRQSQHIVHDQNLSIAIRVLPSFGIIGVMEFYIKLPGRCF